MKNKILISLVVVFTLVLSINMYSIFADLGGGFENNLLPGKNQEQVLEINARVDMIWATTVLILQILSVGGVIFAGVRYMFASSDKRANIKSSLILLVIGMVLTFGASTVAGFVRTSFVQVIK